MEEGARERGVQRSKEKKKERKRSSRSNSLSPLAAETRPPSGGSPRTWRRLLAPAARGFRFAATRPGRADGLAPARMESPTASSLSPGGLDVPSPGAGQTRLPGLGTLFSGARRSPRRLGAFGEGPGRALPGGTHTKRGRHDLRAPQCGLQGSDPTSQREPQGPRRCGR